MLISGIKKRLLQFAKYIVAPFFLLYKLLKSKKMQKVTHIKLVSAPNSKMLEKQLGEMFQQGFGLHGVMVHNPGEGLVQMVARVVEIPENEKEPKLEPVNE